MVDGVVLVHLLYQLHTPVGRLELRAQGATLAPVGEHIWQPPHAVASLSNFCGHCTPV